MKKRVRCLYRVSSKKQLDKNDIPMQRIVCKEFISKMPEWEFDKEYIEKGVSGYNKKLEDRDVLQDIKRDALNKEFDVLLVFMFDRLGRREDETPFIVEWFVKQGIEIWSTQEGQQKFDSRADKLINYIRYWQSGGESEKTSIRVRTKQKQMIEEGINIFAIPPYGYRMVKTGIFTKRGVERKTYEVIPSEAKIVKLIFDLFTEEGYGGIRIAKFLNEKGYRTHKGLEWSYSTINNMLRNPIYKGYLCYHKTSIPVGGGKRRRTTDWIYSKQQIPEFVIISEEQYEKAQKIKESRVKKNKNAEEKNNMLYQTKGEMLFTGYIYCGGCGKKLVTRSSKRTIKLDNGEKGYTQYKYYACMDKACGRECTNSKKSYKNNTIEKPVINCLLNYFDMLEKKDLSEYIRKIHKQNEDMEGKELKELEKSIKENKNKIDILKEEIIKVILGESSFSREMLSAVIEEKEEKLKELENRKKDIEIIKKKKELEFEELLSVKKLIPEWKEVFKNANIGKKKMLLSAIIKEIIVYDDKIDIKLNIGINEFINTIKFTDEKGNSKFFENLCNSRTYFINTNLGAF